MRASVRDELRRAERRYREGVAGIRLLPADCRFPVLLAATLYAEHHRLVRAREFDVLTHRPSLSTVRRFRVLVRTWATWRRLGDPESVFYRVSPVPERPGEPRKVSTANAPSAPGIAAAIRRRAPGKLRSVGTMVPWAGK